MSYVKKEGDHTEWLVFGSHIGDGYDVALPATLSSAKNHCKDEEVRRVRPAQVQIGALHACRGEEWRGRWAKALMPGCTRKKDSNPTKTSRNKPLCLRSSPSYLIPCTFTASLSESIHHFMLSHP
ncbi:hypothetical protein MUK42_28137 [Musa troglodytarum]|uniref:Uncharacterized protein n=1 Tax=Musa troglodytarum TaxID=320322 RepID=A0A9E7KC63_9LILI|nr:hypothetical protein MUK42_28137 [Musa troglodytarum]